MLSQFGTSIAGFMFIWATFQQFVPYYFRQYIGKFCSKVVKYFYPYVVITFPEFSTGDRFRRSEAYAAIETYLGSISTKQAKRLEGDIVPRSQELVLSMDKNEEVLDRFNGITISWVLMIIQQSSRTISLYSSDLERRCYKLTFHERDRENITKEYLKHVLKEGKEIKVRNRQRMLYTNNQKENSMHDKVWSRVVFEHPATFETLAMDTKKKEEIINDLVSFTKRKEYYLKIGKAWKRGYLLCGPAGTGKSTMIAAMANLLNYDVYDVELTSVRDNTELRKLLINTSSKSIVVIEDIDCSLNLSGHRNKEKENDQILKYAKEDSKTKVTLSGLLNFIDGLWSSCVGERIIVFTTNHVDKLDPALIRRGRMDMHIELSYCKFEAFKVLAKNFLDIDSHDFFGTIDKLMEETNITPADVSEYLMLKTTENVTSCLERLIQVLETAKEDAMLQSQKEAEEKKTLTKEQI